MSDTLAVIKQEHICNKICKVLNENQAAMFGVVLTKDDYTSEELAGMILQGPPGKTIAEFTRDQQYNIGRMIGAVARKLEFKDLVIGFINGMDNPDDMNPAKVVTR